MIIKLQRIIHNKGKVLETYLDICIYKGKKAHEDCFLD